MDDLKIIRSKIKENAQALDEITQLTMTDLNIIERPRFYVARKWNSWYPSYFNVVGGGYIFEIKNELIVIDPGFNFTRILREFGLNPKNVNSIFLTHLHSDHIAGLIEFITIRFQLSNKDKLPPLKIYANEANFNFFGHIISGNSNLNQVSVGSVVNVFSDKLKSVIAKVIICRSHHREQGGQDTAIGLKFEININEKITYKVGLTSDTDGSNEYMSEYLANYGDVDIFIPHLGTAEEGKHPTGEKHLYLEGLDYLLKLLNNPRLVLIGEFGLEMGSLPEIVEGVAPQIFSNPRTIFRKSIEKIINDKSDSKSNIALFTISFKAMIDKKHYFEIIRDIGELLNSEEGWWNENKTTWTYKCDSLNTNIVPPDDLLEILRPNESISYRRKVDYITYEETPINSLMKKIENFINKINEIGFLPLLFEIIRNLDFKSLVESLYRNRRIIIYQIKDDISFNRKLFDYIKNLVEIKNYRLINVFIDQILVTNLLLFLQIKYFHESNKTKILKDVDFRNEIASYFDKKYKNLNKRVIAGEYGTTIELGEDIYFGTYCEGCKGVYDLTNIRFYKFSEYNSNKKMINHLRGLCDNCQQAEEHIRYEEEGDEILNNQYALERLEWIEDQKKIGNYKYVFEIGPFKYLDITLPTDYNLEKRLDDHLYLMDELNKDFEFNERMVVKSIKCPNCSGRIFHISVKEEFIEYCCSNPNCSYILKFSRQENQIRKLTNTNIHCTICENDKFELILGFEYKFNYLQTLELTHDDFSSVHSLIYCLRCQENQVICCNMEKEEILSLIKMNINFYAINKEFIFYNKYLKDIKSLNSSDFVFIIQKLSSINELLVNSVIIKALLEIDLNLKIFLKIFSIFVFEKFDWLLAFIHPLLKEKKYIKSEVKYISSIIMIEDPILVDKFTDKFSINY